MSHRRSSHAASTAMMNSLVVHSSDGLEHIELAAKHHDCGTIQVGDTAIFHSTGERVTVVEVWADAIGDYYTIRLPNGREMEIDCCELDFEVTNKSLPAG